MIIRALFVAVFSLLPFVVHSAERGTRAEAQAMVERAIAYYEAHGLEALAAKAHDVNVAEFHDRDLYVFAVGFDGISVIQGSNEAFVGRDLSAIKDPNGTAFVKEMIALAQNEGKGWVEYYFSNPQTQELSKKASWVQRLNENTLVGVGVYAD